MLWFLLFAPKVGHLDWGISAPSTGFDWGISTWHLVEFHPNSLKVIPWTGGFPDPIASQLTQISTYTSNTWYACSPTNVPPYAFYLTEVAEAVSEIFSLDWGISCRDLARIRPVNSMDWGISGMPLLITIPDINVQL